MTAGSDDDSSRRTEAFAWRPPDRLVVLGRFISPVLIVGLPVLLVLLALRPGQMLAGSDFILTFYYIRGAVGDALASGHLPVWDPHAMCGSPPPAAPPAGPGVRWLAAALPLAEPCSAFGAGH